MTPTATPKLLLLAAGCAASLWLGSCGDSGQHAGTAAATTPDADFDQFKTRFIDSLWYYNPEWAADQGYHRYDSLLVIPTAARRQTEAAALARRRKDLAAFQAEQLSVNNQTDFYLIQNYLDRSRWQTDTLRGWQWNPAGYNIGGMVSELLSGRYHPLDRRLRNISEKISRSAEYYEAARQNISRPTKEHTALAILQNKGGIQVFGPALLDSIRRSGLSAREKKDFRDRIATTRLVMENYISFLEKEVLPQGQFRSFRIGKALFDRKFVYDIQSAYSADQLYAKAQQHRQELLHDMGRRAARLWPKYFPNQPQPADSFQLIKRVIGKLSEKHARPADFAAAVKQQIPTLIKFVNDKKLLTQDPTKPLVVRDTPPYMRGGAGASISAPGPYDKAANTYYNVEPVPADWTPAQAESYLREYNDYTLQILNIHEAIPGHYTQLVYANRSPSLIKSIFGNGAMVEGWAVYTERMMLESGYGGGTDEMWLMWDKWNMRVTLNAILDHDVHVKNASENDVVTMLMRDGFQEEAEARGKWKRATQSQVQLSSYFTGYTEIYALREELKKQQGAKFDLKAFNEQFLSYGSAPVKYIRTMMLKKS
ncbi:Uncharacterized conserved protein, DUF885 familyt [Hymenobacter daecheongensis DSM 21074]|uniref:Uncharacterized conserved protein, DUF885 familyt n=1 Tax=Hymenobacter daecheongensis DSM 21074 TaxID=1121955 RepID=A0A1M6E9T2_9BACT|nr:DUF885 domain-containing protein [Hymenobacter daecheongensis]SHI82277.1 Uncharacterized conserved protein, DUF885 familyt [Hymenobacter daecheongensis DSM 21074]